MGSALSRWTQSTRAVEGAAGSCAVSTHMVVPAAEAEAADTCSQALMTPFPNPLPLPR